jgi:hypothetical protein
MRAQRRPWHIGFCGRRLLSRRAPTARQPCITMSSSPADGSCDSIASQRRAHPRRYSLHEVINALRWLVAAFDRTSHLASDTLRPSLVTTLPVWAVAIAGAWALLRAPAPSRDA